MSATDALVTSVLSDLPAPAALVLPGGRRIVSGTLRLTITVANRAMLAPAPERAAALERIAERTA